MSTLSLKLHLIDDHPVLLRGLTMTLEATGRFQVVDVTSDALAVGSALERTRADVVVLDLLLGARNGLDLLHRALIQRPDLRVLVFSAQDSRCFAEPVLRAGARGYLDKSSSITELIEAVDTVGRGEVYVSGSTLEHMLRHHLPTLRLSTLSTREITVLHTLINHARVADVAECLCISPRTVESHIHNICEKLGLSGIDELRHFAMQWRTPDAAAPQPPLREAHR